MYAEGWRQKIELNATLEEVKEVPLGSYVNPIVTAVIRRDGTVEAIIFVRHSGSERIDNAVRKIITALAPYPVFPPDLGLDYDAIEIRRTWTFNTAVRLFGGTL
jgi:hypothetical protein